MRFKKACCGFLFAVLMASRHVRAQDNSANLREDWIGVNHGDFPIPMLLADLKATGLRMVRDGFNAEPNKEIDDKVNAYVAAGIDAHISLNMRGNGVNVADYPSWLANYRQRCVDIMTAYKGKIHYYIIGNEPDKRDPSTGKISPEQAVDFTRMAYEASRQVDPSGGIKIESPPLSSPQPIKDYLPKMLTAGLNDHCDYIGIHVYSSQINDGRLDYPWRMQQANGGTQKPIAVSEMGMSDNWAPKGSTPEQMQQWKADFLDRAYVQLKRYGMSNVILFEAASASSFPATFNLLRDGSSDHNIMTITYSEIQNHLRAGALLDAGFETSNDPKRQWVVYDDLSHAGWDVSAFNFQAPGGHTGASALQIDTSGKGKRIVRQVVEGMTPGKAITITAWAFSNDMGGATLKAEGYNATAGNIETAATTSANGAWSQLAVTVTPTNPWVVIELSSPADEVAGSYVKFDDVAITPAQ